MAALSSWRGLLTVALLAGAVASGWSVWKLSQPATAGVLQSRPDYVLHDYEIIVLDKQGHESFTLRGPTLQRDPADKTMSLVTPQFLVPDRNGHYWDVRARQGLVPAGGERLDLSGDVVAKSPPETPPATGFSTQKLSLFPNDNRATSAVEVTVTRPGLTMQGIGMQADFDSQQVSLLSQVRTRYVPQR